MPLATQPAPGHHPDSVMVAVRVARPRGVAASQVGRLVRQPCPRPLKSTVLMDEEMDARDSVLPDPSIWPLTRPL